MKNSIDVIQTGSLYGRGRNMAGRIYDTDGLSPAIRTPSGGNDMPCIVSGYFEKSTVIEYASK